VTLLLITLVIIVAYADEPREAFPEVIMSYSSAVEQAMNADLLDYLESVREEIQADIQIIADNLTEVNSALDYSSVIHLWGLAILTFQTALIVIIIFAKGWGHH
jgi:hypothetical protein